MFSKIRRTCSFHGVISQMTSNKCTKIQNACAEPLFCSLSILFANVLIAVVIMFCVTSLLFSISYAPHLGLFSSTVVVAL